MCGYDSIFGDNAKHVRDALLQTVGLLYCNHSDEVANACFCKEMAFLCFQVGTNVRNRFLNKNVIYRAQEASNVNLKKFGNSWLSSRNAFINGFKC